MDDVDLCYLPATEALDAASAAEQRYHRGEAAGPLNGLPVAINARATSRTSRHRTDR